MRTNCIAWHKALWFEEGFTALSIWERKMSTPIIEELAKWYKKKKERMGWIPKYILHGSNFSLRLAQWRWQSQVAHSVIQECTHWAKQFHWYDLFCKWYLWLLLFFVLLLIILVHLQLFLFTIFWKYFF